MNSVKTRAGYATIIGLPNSGKSTLMNALLGQKISITTSKPQTTRKSILGILTENNYQVIFLDTPGILEPGYLLQEKMMEAVSTSVRDADILIYLIDLQDDPDGTKLFGSEFVKNSLKNNAHKIAVLNKADLSDEIKIKKTIADLTDTGNFIKVIPVSALLLFNIFSLHEAIMELLPEHPKYFPDDIVAEENERFFVAELIREKIFEQFKEEIPYSTEVIISDFKERDKNKDFIQAEIIVERDTQKAIIIGKQGSAIKRLGQNAREAVEQFLGKPVYLDIRVKVKSKWRSDERMLKLFGYSKKGE
jgi:GTP-binding protein Era